MRILILGISIFLMNFSYSQNLVINPSFEEYERCFNSNELQFFACANWDSVGYSTPDLFNHCNTHISIGVPNNFVGYQEAKDGYNYIGLMGYSYNPFGGYYNRREYAYSQLTETLQADSTYYVSFWLGMHDEAMYAIKNFGAFISHSIPDTTNGQLIDTIAQIKNTVFIDDTARWYKVEGEFVANGGEEYISLGNFDHDSLVDWYRLYPHNNPNDGFDGVYFIIDSVYLSLKSQVPVEPEDTTVVTDPPVDTAAVDSLDYFIVYPNPSNGIFEIKSSEPINEITIYDEAGRLIQSQNEGNIINLSKEESGIYFIEVETAQGIKRKKIVLQHY